MDQKITYEDVAQHQHLFSLMPSFLLERMAKKNSNLVKKFESSIHSYLAKLNDAQRNKLDIVLSSDVDELQAVMHEAYSKTNKKHFKILANPKYKEFIVLNIDELRKIV